MTERLKVMIADDEPMVCVVVQSSIHWEELELELVGVAHDGLGLMEKMKAAKPDIIITDISMPELGGLDFIEQVRRENGTCRFIIISSYRQFEYAHKALKNNVEDYLLKPIDEQELNETLLRLKTAILGERMHDPEVVERLMTNNQKDKENIRRIFLEQLIAQDAAPNLDEDAIARQYGIQFGDGIYQAVEVKFDVSSQGKLDTSLASIQTKLISISRKILGKETAWRNSRWNWM
ncbi:MAG: response regulator [Candidatus Limivivens sp.]|nr:response regulator [Candidatus Limivivens sp.]